MKTFLTTVAIATALSTAAIAGDFDNTTFGVDATSGALDLSVDGTEDGLTAFAVGATGFAHEVAGIDASVRGELAYDFGSDAIGVRGEYNVVTAVAPNMTVYGSAAIQYATLNTDLSDGDFYFDPSAGVTYAFNEMVSVFGEVGYAWNMSSDWDRVGGYVEVGMPLNVTNSVAVIPSLVRGFDDGVEETNASLRVAVSF